jgi:hypothetical protein
MISNGATVKKKKKEKRKGICLYLHHLFVPKQGGPGGCAQGQSSVQATEEQKEKFKELVELLKGVGQNFAVSAA